MQGLRPLCDLEIRLEPPLERGNSPRGWRRVIPIVGGKVLGRRLQGEVLPGGPTGRRGTGTAPRSSRLATRCGLDDGALIEVTNFGYRHGPAEVLARAARRSTRTATT
jgi:hypothetical protein